MVNIIEQTKDVYNKIASHFSSTRKYLWADLAPLKKFAQAGDKVLDLGCGNGRLYQLFGDLSINYTGLDQSNELLKIARVKFPEGKFVEGEMTKLPFADSEFDIIYCIAAFHHLPDEESRLKALGEMKRVLKLGGKVVMTNWNLMGEWGKRNEERGKWTKIEGDSFLVPWKNSKSEIVGNRYYHSFKLDELVKLFEKFGFKIEEQYYVKKGERSDEKQGENVVSVLIR